MAGQRAAAASAISTSPLLTLLVFSFGGALEEIGFRGFLLPRLRTLTGRWWLAFLAMAVVFGAGHLAWDPLWAIQATWLGIVLGLIFLWRRSVVAGMVAHALNNAIAVAGWVLMQSGG